jgi:hypothetical protein
MEKLTLRVVEFSRTPGFRKIKDGPFSGELFLKDFLRPRFQKALDQNAILVVDLDGTAGYGTSFLEESFGGLSREHGAQTVFDHLEVISEDEPYLADDIRTYIEEANSETMVSGG